MTPRPRSITIISWLFIAVGSIALGYHLLPWHIRELQAGPARAYELFWMCLVRAIAILCGVYMLFAANWARWLLALWLAFHILLSFYHSLFQGAVHTALFGVIVYLLFRPPASAYFRRRAAETPA